MRVFAGPNGSGKTTIIKKLQSEIPFGVYVNADDIQKILFETQKLIFDTYQLKITENTIQLFFKNSTFSPQKRDENDLYKKLKIKNNVLEVNTKIDSYLAADIAEFIRQQLLENNISFTFETVMSHSGKVAFLQKAKDYNYKVYLYYVATNDVEINIDRVLKRVAQNGHNVAKENIIKRYYKSLENLKNAVKISNRAYLFDNSGEAAQLISEIENGIDVSIIDTKNIPNWVIEYLIK